MNKVLIKYVFFSLLVSCITNDPGTDYIRVDKPLMVDKKICLPTDHPSLEPKLLYHWKQRCEDNQMCWNQVMSAPSIGDLDGDGSPEIVFTTFPQKIIHKNIEGAIVDNKHIYKDDGSILEIQIKIPRRNDNNTAYSNVVGDLKVLDGKTGKLKWSYGKLPNEWISAPHSTATPLIMDIDRDGKAEIFLPGYDFLSILAFNHDGSLRWRLPVNFINSFFGGYSGSDINGDGIGDILAGNLVVTENKDTKEPYLLLNGERLISTAQVAATLDPNHPEKMQIISNWGIHDASTGERKIKSEISLGSLAIADLYKEVPGNEIVIVDHQGRKGKTFIHIYSPNFKTHQLDELIPPFELPYNQDRWLGNFREKTYELRSNEQTFVQIEKVKGNIITINIDLESRDKIIVNKPEIGDRVYLGLDGFSGRKENLNDDWEKHKDRVYYVTEISQNELTLDRSVAEAVELGDSIILSSIAPAGRGGPPNIGDYDGDGELDISIAGSVYYTVFKKDGSILWKSDSQDISSNATGSTLFDFNGDSKAEILYADERKFRIFNGEDGKVVAEIPNSSGTINEYPLVVDVNGDNSANIVLVSNNYGGQEHKDWAKSGPGIRVFGSKKENAWVSTRRVWNQFNYFVSNVNDDLTSISKTPIEDGRQSSFRQNVLNIYQPKQICR